MELKEEIQSIIEGEVKNDEATLREYSRDTSLFEVRPEIVVFPKNTRDVENIVRFVDREKTRGRAISLTGRSAGSDMTGGPLNESIILGFTPHFTKYEVDEENLEARVEPGVFYRIFEKDILPEHLSMPVYPASKNLAAFGGMIMNNCGGEKTLKYGQMRDFVKELRVVLADGHEYSIRKLTKGELNEKMAQDTFEGEFYSRMFRLVYDNHDLIQEHKPQVSKNSSGYNLWDIYDHQEATFDLTQLFVGSQGTLGMLVGAKIRLVHELPEKRLIALFFKSWDQLPDVVNALLPHEPMSLETFDDETMKLGIRFMPEIAKAAGTTLLSFAWNFLPEARIALSMGGIPKLVVLVELEEESIAALDEKTEKIEKALQEFELQYRVLREDAEMEKYWVMRHESFNLLRQHVRGKRTAPFIEDFCVQPKYIPEFLPKALAILRENKIKVNIAGHAGNGNFHIIPLMDLSKKKERAKITRVADVFYDLVLEYGGTITAEHNDGIIRTPYIQKMFGDEMYALFREVKNIFDPQGIFNPGKKTGGSIEYIEEHIIKD